jgi:hypothetical protein
MNVSSRVRLSCISAAARWEIPTLRELAIFNLNKAGLVARFVTAHLHGEEHWLRPALEDICRREASLSDDEINILGDRDAAYISRVREQL